MKRLKRCINMKHIDGGWYKGRQHYLGFEGEPGIIITEIPKQDFVIALLITKKGGEYIWNQ